MDRHFVDNLWRWKCGLPELEAEAPQVHTYEELQQTEWSEEFENLMRNRLVMGALRYGPIHGKNKPMYDRVSSVVSRIARYAESGNKELLVDVANLCLLEFEECHHPNAHFSSEDDGEHVKRK